MIFLNLHVGRELVALLNKWFTTEIVGHVRKTVVSPRRILLRLLCHQRVYLWAHLLNKRYNVLLVASLQPPLLPRETDIFQADDSRTDSLGGFDACLHEWLNANRLLYVTYFLWIEINDACLIAFSRHEWSNQSSKLDKIWVLLTDGKAVLFHLILNRFSPNGAVTGISRAIN